MVVNFYVLLKCSFNSQYHNKTTHTSVQRENNFKQKLIELRSVVKKQRILKRMMKSIHLEIRTIVNLKYIFYT